MTEWNQGQLSEQLGEGSPSLKRNLGGADSPTLFLGLVSWVLELLMCIFSPFPDIYKVCVSMSLIIIFQNDFSFVCMCIYDTSVRVYMTAELHI